MGHDGDEKEELAAGPTYGVDEDLGRGDAGGRRYFGGVVLNGKGDTNQEDPAGYQRHNDRHHDPSGAGNGRVPGLLGHMCRGVVAGEGVLRDEKADEEGIHRRTPAGESGVVDELGEDERDRLMMGGDDGQCDDDGQHAEDVPPHAHVGQERHDADAERVEDAMEDQDAGVNQDHVPVRCGREPGGEIQERGEEERRPEVDSGCHGHLAEQG